MRVLLLTNNVFVYSSRRIRAELLAHGHDVCIAAPAQIRITITPDGPSISMGDTRLDTCDGIVVRSSPHDWPATLRIAAAMQHARSLTPLAGLRIAGDKYLTAQRLMQTKVVHPPTMLIHDPTDADHALVTFGKIPLVAKRLHGSQGRGVALIDGAQESRSIIEMLVREGPLLLQPYITSGGIEYRALVIQDQIVAAVRKHHAHGEFRGNAHRGASFEVCALDPDMQDAALRAARAVELGFAGVDMVRGPHGPLVYEVNAVPGLRATEEACGVNVAALLAQALSLAQEAR